MTLGKYLIAMSLVAAICWLSWVIVLYQIDPFSAGILGFVLFYLTLFFALTSTLAIIGLIFRRWLIKNQLAIQQVAKALRQGVLFAILIIVSLILSSFDLLTWWNMVLLIAILAVLEFFFLSNEKI